MKSNAKRIAVVPGDGIGPEVISEAVAVLERLGETHGVKLNLRHFDWGAEKFLSEGVGLPDGALEMLARAVHRLGSLGSTRTGTGWPTMM